MIESARIDGASDWRILRRIVLPVSKAVTAVIALFYAVGYWNSWFNILLFMPADSAKWPLQMVMYNYVTQGMTMPGSGSNIVGAEPRPPADRPAVPADGGGRAHPRARS